MRLYSNKIHTGTKSTTLSELFKRARTQSALEKTASTKIASEKEKEVEETEEVIVKDEKPWEKDKKEDKKEDKEGCSSSSKKDVKKAEKDEAPTSGQPQAEAKLVNKPEMPKEEKAKSGKQTSCKDEAETSGQPQAEAKLVNTPKVEDKKEATAKTPVKTSQYIKIAELSEEQRKFVRKIYEIYWPKEFVDALLAKK